MSIKDKNIYFLKITQRITLIFMSILIFVCGGEIYFRLFKGDFYYENKLQAPTYKYPRDTAYGIFEYRGYTRNKEGFVNIVKNNSLGFHDREPSTDQSLKNILVLGDSFVEAYQVGVDNIFTKRLEDLLNKNNPQKEFQVIGFGRGGWAARNNLATLKQYIKQYKPVLIISTLVWNDILDELPTSDAIKGEWNKLFNSELVDYFPWIAHSRFLLFISLKATDLYRKYGWVIEYKNQMKFYNPIYVVYQSPESKAAIPGWENLKRDVLAINGYAQLHYAKYLLVVLPDCKDGKKIQASELKSTPILRSFNWDFNNYENGVQKYLANNRFPILDLSPFFYGKIDFYDSYYVDGHWNAEGHALAANEIYAYITKNGQSPYIEVNQS